MGHKSNHSGDSRFQSIFPCSRVPFGAPSLTHAHVLLWDFRRAGLASDPASKCAKAMGLLPSNSRSHMQLIAGSSDVLQMKSLHTNGCGSNIGTQNGTLVNGNMD